MQTSEGLDSSNKQQGYVEVVLDAYTCGDNCYIEYFDNVPNSERKRAICLAEQCGAWETPGNLPAELKNRVVLVKLGSAKQYDAAWKSDGR